MTLFFYIVIAIVTFFAFLHAWTKKSFDVSRTIVINAPIGDVYAFVRQLKNRGKWMPWFKKNIGTVHFKGVDGKTDAMMYWKGRTQKIGEGTEKIIKIKPNKIIETKVIMIKPTKFVALSYFGFKEIDNKRTKMVWGIRGFSKFPLSIINIFFSVDNIFGDHIEEGVQSIKKYFENK
ncbi:SRPBCC family protein [Zunongwangia sp.]|uniref:SRPBCC family protein n=1 Tax=Zunongwangia sp. TaxID=1965325 RepID=UPI003AA95795